MTSKERKTFTQILTASKMTVVRANRTNVFIHPQEGKTFTRVAQMKPIKLKRVMKPKTVYFLVKPNTTDEVVLQTVRPPIQHDRRYYDERLNDWTDGYTEDESSLAAYREFMNSVVEDGRALSVGPAELEEITKLLKL